MIENESNKKQKLSVLILLVLIPISLIVIISIVSPINQMRGETYFIEINSEELDNFGLNSIENGITHYTEDYYTFEEFGRYTNQNISNFDDILKYASKENYELKYDEEFIAEFMSKEKCEFDSIRKKELCLTTTLTVYKTENIILLSVSSVKDYAGLRMIKSSSSIN